MADAVNGQAPRSLPSLIAWLSLCAFSAGWGPHFGSDAGRLFIAVGAFGLVAAVGLDVVERQRQWRQSWAQRRASHRRMKHLVRKPDRLSPPSDQPAAYPSGAEPPGEAGNGSPPPAGVSPSARGARGIVTGGRESAIVRQWTADQR